MTQQATLQRHARTAMPKYRGLPAIADSNVRVLQMIHAAGRLTSATALTPREPMQFGETIFFRGSEAQVSHPADFFNRLEMRAPLNVPPGPHVAAKPSTPKCFVLSGVDAQGISITRGPHPIVAVAFCAGWLDRHSNYAVIPIEPCNTTRRAALPITLEASGGNPTPRHRVAETAIDRVALRG